jgi:hypothetical protein
MQSLEMGRKSCQLKLNYQGDKCEVFFAEGQVKHATYLSPSGELVGDPAVFRVLRWTGGNFELNFEGTTDQETTQLNTQGLLMEGLRLLDEEQRDGVGEVQEEGATGNAEVRVAGASASGGEVSARSPGGGKREEEEEDVLLDN